MKVQEPVKRVNVPWRVILPATESKPIAGASALKHTDAVRRSY